MCSCALHSARRGGHWVRLRPGPAPAPFESTLAPVDSVEGQREGRVNQRPSGRARQGPATKLAACPWVAEPSDRRSGAGLEPALQAAPCSPARRRSLVRATLAGGLKLGGLISCARGRCNSGPDLCERQVQIRVSDRRIVLAGCRSLARRSHELLEVDDEQTSRSVSGGLRVRGRWTLCGHGRYAGHAPHSAFRSL